MTEANAKILYEHFLAIDNKEGIKDMEEKNRTRTKPYTFMGVKQVEPLKPKKDAKKST